MILQKTEMVVVLGMLLGWGGAGCSSEEPVDPSCDGANLFGTPSENTGLTDSQCMPSCTCGGELWEAPSYTEEQIVAMESLTLVDSPSTLASDPYAAEQTASPDDTKFCGVLIDAADPTKYRLVSYESEAAAADAGAHITHRSACGQCSSLENLAVYMRYPDLTDPVRMCGVTGMTQGEEANIECLMEIGFDLPCAQIWYFNTNNTRALCLDPCLAALNLPNHTEDATLNECLQCDEEHSGPVFKAVSGRTRRNSGLPSALCRPCDSVYQLAHSYQ